MPVQPSGEASLPAIIWTVVLIEAIIGALADIGIQLAFNGGNVHGINWGQVAASGAIAGVGGLFGHAARVAHYMKTPAHRKAWAEGAKGGFSGYLLKFLGAGTGTSLKRHHYTPVFRAII